jgi:isopentenyl diphosphate isomerase/L-lactate dehydrogenase-like FMN-dependent dehydrogenase
MRWLSPAERCVSIDDLRAAARRRLPRMIFDYIDGGAGSEVTLRANRAAFESVRWQPHVLVDVSARSQATTVLGRRLSIPVVCGPTGIPRLVHPAGELATARATATRGSVLTVGTASSYAVDRIAAEIDSPLWFQLYAWRDRALTKYLITRARNAGCEALFVTVDTPVAGKRERDLRNGMTIPPRITTANAVETVRHPLWAYRTLLRGPSVRLPNLDGADAAPADGAIGPAGWIGQLINAAQTWDDLSWIRDQWPGALAVKGIMTAEDAVRAAETGANAVVVSNHGGRQLDGLPATLSVLPHIVAALPAGDVDVLIDGGVRRGSDVAACLALGAKACLIGRPWLYGLAVAGQAGVERALDILSSELDAVLALLGRPNVNNLDLTALDPRWARSLS